MNNNGFDSIAQAVLMQKQLMDKLEKENRELRRQLTELRAGYNIFVEIEGQRFPLQIEGLLQASPLLEAQQVQDVQNIQQDFTPPVIPVSLSEETVAPIDEEQDSMEVIPTLELAPAEEIPPQQEEQEKAPTFLEEIMLDEFAAASTTPLSVWKGVSKKQPQPQIDEEEKAALRRELMGSFLLE